MFWSVAMILGYFFIGIAKVVEGFNVSPADRPAYAKSRDPVQVVQALFLWPRYVPMPWAALTAHVLIVAAILWGLGYFIDDLFVRAGVVVGMLAIVLSWYTIRVGRRVRDE